MNRRWTCLGGAVVLAACAASAGCRAPRAAPPAPAEAREVDMLPDPYLVYQVHNMCVVRNGQVTQLTLVSGATTVDGRPWSEAFPAADYAGSAPWFVNNEPIALGGHRYVRYGLPRTFGPDGLVPAGSYRGVAVFAEPHAGALDLDVVYVPIHEMCEFQPYQIAEAGAAVRG
ncbi:MAG TPA: hypothetical protein VFJ82_00440 [Longimicrobium sp.]|nr:hypothetical protein [Longimicrobium sp.]